MIYIAVNEGKPLLTNDPTQLTGQLFGRMLSINSTEIQDFLRRAKNSTSHPWLHPLNPALSQVDEPLIWTLTGHPSGVNCVAIAPDGPTAVSGSGARWEKGTVLKIWNLDVGQEIASIEGPFNGFKAVAITPNGRLAVTGCGDGTVRIWELNTWAPLHTLSGHSGSVQSVAVTREGKYAVSGSSDQTVRIWDLIKNKPVFTLKGHTGIVSCVSLTPCDNYIVSASHDSSLKIWSLANGELIASFTGEGAFTYCVAAPDGRTIVIGDVSGRLLFLYLHFPDGFEQSQ